MPSHFNVNKVMLMGRLGADPEVSATSSGQTKCRMSIATSFSCLDKQKNDWVERTCWHKVIAWGKQGDLCKQYLARGRKVFVEGRLDSRSYKAKDGQQRFVQEIVTDNVIFLESRKDGGSPPLVPAPSGLEAGPEPADEDSHDLPF